MTGDDIIFRNRKEIEVRKIVGEIPEPNTPEFNQEEGKATERELDDLDNESVNWVVDHNSE